MFCSLRPRASSAQQSLIPLRGPCEQKFLFFDGGIFVTSRAAKIALQQVGMMTLACLLQDYWRKQDAPLGHPRYLVYRDSRLR